MRYTTIIDITDIPTVYSSRSATTLYLHLVLKSGYHDDDRDLITTSIRRLCLATGLTLSACRHALAVLQAAGLITREGTALRVKKWLPEQPISARPKKKTSGAIPDTSAAALERALEQERRQREQEERQRNAITYEDYLKQRDQGKKGGVRK